MTDELFNGWLDATRKLQLDYYGFDFDKMSDAERTKYMLENAWAASDELHEAMNEISWKPWAKSEFFNREAFIGETVDALHFLANWLCAAKCTTEELNVAYLEKMERNRKRQRSNYTGLDKCILCKRAKDDVIAHGGEAVTDATTGEFYCGEHVQ